MSEERAKNLSSAKAREERLAAKLRENLRRRKAQSRAAAGAAPGAHGESDSAQPLPNSSTEG